MNSQLLDPDLEPEELESQGVRSVAVESDGTARQYRYFPGWTMVGVAAAAQFMSAPGQSYSVAAFKEPMRESLAVSETNYSLAYAVATIISGLLLPGVGRLVDRSGARWSLPAIALLLGFACIGMSMVTGLGSLYLGFSCVRALGQGALGLVGAWLIGEWFARRRGLATALSGLGGTLSVMTIPVINAMVISRYGWEAGWIVLGVAVWVVLLPPSLLLIRNRPEELGLLPDGDDESQPHDTRHHSKPLRPSVAIQTDWSVHNVVRDTTFWKLLAVPATSGMVGTGLIFHAVSLLGSRGVSEGWAMALISLQATVASIVVLIAGWLTDRLPARYLLATAMMLLAAASFTVLVLPHPLVAIAYAVMLGLHGSILRSTGTVVWINYYGRQNQGSIRGIAMAVMIFAAAAGPLPLALSIDWFATYNIALYGFIGIPLLSGALVMAANPPRHEPGTESTTT